MAERPRTILICSCEDTMPLDGDAVSPRLPRRPRSSKAAQFCRAELERFRKAAASGEPVTVACTQEAPLFSEIADEMRDDNPLTFVNIRERAGWSKDAAKAGPKMAALIAASAEPNPDVPFVSLTSDGVALLYGSDERTIEAANLLKDHLDVTVLIRAGRRNCAAPRDRVSHRQGQRSAAPRVISAHSKLAVDDYATPTRRRAARLNSEPPRNGAVSRCDIVLDLSGGPPLFPAADLRDGYLRADPGDPAAMLRAVLKARDLIGTFDKPRYITFTEDLCAHSRSKIVGCRRCLDLCPTGAIAPPAITWRSTRKSAPAAANAPPPARPAPRPMRCRPPTR